MFNWLRKRIHTRLYKNYVRKNSIEHGIAPGEWIKVVNDPRGNCKGFAYLAHIEYDDLKDCYLVLGRIERPTQSVVAEVID